MTEEFESKKLHNGMRKGYGFDSLTRQRAKERANGYCEWPDGCQNPHNGAVDHLTGIYLGRLLQIPAEDLTAIDNAQLLCNRHADIKYTQEQVFVRMIEKGLNDFQPERATVEWEAMAKPTVWPWFLNQPEKRKP